jgi:hypothetical protein
MSRAYRWSMDEQLRTELLRRVEIDQVARKAMDLDGVREADGENLPWLKGVVAGHGWPGASLVGTDGAHAAWLLAQHADADPGFQRQCLDLLTAAVEAGEATKSQLAYLTDRVLLAEGEPQVFGTQVTRKDGQMVPLDLRDPNGLDERRAAAGLEPFAEYARLFDHPPRQDSRLKCPGCGAWAPYDRPAEGEPVTVTCPECALETTMRLKR